jgi:hypothetical protein
MGAFGGTGSRHNSSILRQQTRHQLLDAQQYLINLRIHHGCRAIKKGLHGLAGSDPENKKAVKKS